MRKRWLHVLAPLILLSLALTLHYRYPQFIQNTFKSSCPAPIYTRAVGKAKQGLIRDIDAATTTALAHQLAIDIGVGIKILANQDIMMPTRTFHLRRQFGKIFDGRFVKIGVYSP